MPIAFSCQQCAKAYRVAETFAGKRIRCKQCQAVIDVPPVESVAPLYDAPDPKLPIVRPMAQARPMPLPQQPGVATPFGTVVQTRTGPRRVNAVFLVGAALMLFGFMTPWISVEGIIRISGFQIPVMFNKLASAMGDKSGQFLVLYFMYFIPLSCLAAVVDEFLSAKGGRNRWYLRLTAALSPLIAFLLIVATFPSPNSPKEKPHRQNENERSSTSSGGPSVFDFIGFGLWLSLAGFAVSFAGVFTSPKPGPAPVAFLPRARRAPLAAPPKGPSGAAPRKAAQAMRNPPRE